MSWSLAVLASSVTDRPRPEQRAFERLEAIGLLGVSDVRVDLRPGFAQFDGILEFEQFRLFVG